MKTFTRYKIYEENKSDLTFESTQSIKLEQSEYPFEGIIKRFKIPCYIRLCKDMNSIDVCIDILNNKKGAINPTDILLVNSRNNEEEIKLRTDMLKTGIGEDGIYFTRFINITRDKAYNKISQPFKSVSMLTFTPSIKTPSFKRVNGLNHKTYSNEIELSGMKRDIQFVFNIANKLEASVIIFEMVGCENGYNHPLEDIIHFIKECIMIYKFSFREVVLCFKDNKFGNIKQIVDMLNLPVF